MASTSIIWSLRILKSGVITIKHRLRYDELGPVQTSNFSCTEPNVAIKYMKSSTYESIWIGKFVFGTTVPFYPTRLVG